MRYGGVDYLFMKDALGSITEIINSSGGLYAQYAYDAWGNTVYKTGSLADVNPFRFRGYYMDLDAGFYYLQTRYYDPVIRRFINADDYELMPQLADNIGELNLYSYCNNNPVMYTDPTGEGIWEVIRNVAIAVAIVAVVVTVVAGTIATGGGLAIGLGGALAISATAASSIAVTAAVVAVVAVGVAASGSLIGTLAMSKGSGPRMGHNQHEKKQMKEAKRQLGINENDYNIKNRIHKGLKNYDYAETVDELIEVIKKILGWV